MPYENYLTEDEFHDSCVFWARVENEIASRYNPNPWLFQSGCRPEPQENRYVFTYRNFDDSAHLTVEFSCKDGKTSFRLHETR